MKRSAPILVIILAVSIVTAGFLMVPGLYGLSFDASRMLETDDDISDTLDYASERFMRNLLYPAYAETVALTDEELDAFIGDMRSNNKGLLRLFEVIGEPYDEGVLSFAQRVRGTEIYIIKTQVESNGHSRNLTIALKDLTPFFYKYGNSEPAFEEIIAQARDYLNSCIEGDMSSIREYTSSIDYLYGEQMDSILMGMEPAQEGKMELSPEEAAALWSRCEGGNWEVHSDGTDTVLVSFMDGYILLLYYDPINREFCGFNFMENSNRR